MVEMSDDSDGAFDSREEASSPLPSSLAAPVPSSAPLSVSGLSDQARRSQRTIVLDEEEEEEEEAEFSEAALPVSAPSLPEVTRDDEWSE
jgi:hypothetical protein